MSDVDLRPFFGAIYGANKVPAGEERYVCISVLRHGGRMVERYFSWPEQMPGALHFINRSIDGGQTRPNNVYYCVSLLTDDKRSKDFLSTTHCVWADLDATPPSKLLLPPSLLIETSPGRHQAIWTLDQAVPYAEAEDLARRIFHAHRKDGADATWDATRLLRVPGTLNTKYEVAGEGHPLVQLVDSRSLAYSPDEIREAYPKAVDDHGVTSIEFDAGQLELVGTSEDILTRYRREMLDETQDLFFDLPDPDQDWSAALWKLEMDCFEVGMDIYEVFRLASEAGCNKYARDGRSDDDLWKELLRARESHERKLGLVLGTQDIQEIDLLTQDEIEAVGRQEDSFIDRYRNWAATRTDAPHEFHVGGALMALSALLSDKFVIPTEFSEIRPNLWIMLLADSTISRKTTSMKLAMHLIEDTGFDPLLATDGSVEGIITELAARERTPSVFLRDEFTSLIAGAKKKDYMAGFLSDLCGMYDGSRVKRRLRKDTIETKNPIFLMFAGGVETKLLELLSQEDITSGFIPRFLPIFGRSSIDSLRLIGQRRKSSPEARAALLDELNGIVAAYTPPPKRMVVLGQEKSSPGEPYEFVLSEDGMKRLQTAHRYLLDVADQHDARDLLLPCTERLVVNVMKVAALVAAARRRPVEDGTVEVHLDDVMLALYYARGWLDHLLKVVNSVGRDEFDSATYRVLEWITRMGEGGVQRSAIMRQFRLSQRDTDAILGTLADREEVVVEGGVGVTQRGARFRATKFARTARQARISRPVQVRRTNVPAATEENP